MSDPLLPSLEIGASREEAELCVLLMHGLGADGHDFEGNSPRRSPPPPARASGASSSHMRPSSR